MSESTYQNDRPISTTSRDELRRNTFASQLAKAVYEYNDPESIAIGLFGDWGTGKTSALSLFQLALAQYPEGYNPPLVIEFNPWRITSEDQLFAAFFTTLTAAIDKVDRKSALNRAWDYCLSKIPWSKVKAADVPATSEVLSRYAVAIAAAHVLGPPGVIAGALAIGAGTISAVARTFLAFARGSDNIEQLKAEVNQRLAKLDRRIVIVLDDIDRLSAVEVRQVFQLIKSVADFDNAIYILALDWTIVENALSVVQGTNGREYLKKIVQIICELPRARPEKLNQILINRFNSVIKDYHGKLEQERFNKVYLESASRLIKTVRDISRTMNTFRFLFELLRHEVNIIDLLGMSILTVSCPELYYFIRDHEDLLCDNPLLRYDSERMKALQEAFKAVITKLPDRDQAPATATVYSLFPYFAERIKGGRRDGYGDERQWEIDLRICSSVRFPTYFEYGVVEGDISQSDVAGFIAESPDETKSDERLMHHIKVGNAGALIAELRSRSDQVPDRGVVPLIRLLLTHGDKIEEAPTRGAFFFLDTPWRVKMLLVHLLRRVPGNRRTTVLEDIIVKSDLGLATQTSLIITLRSIRENHDAGKRDDVYADPLVDNATLDKLESLVANKIREYALSGKLFELQPETANRDAVMLLASWKKWAGADEAARGLRAAMDRTRFSQLIRRFTTVENKTQTFYDMEVLMDLFGKPYLTEQIEALPRDGDEVLTEGCSILRSRLDGVTEDQID